MLLLGALFLLSSAQPLHSLPDDSLRTGSLDEVVVSGRSVVQRLQSVQMGVEHLSAAEMAVAPSLLGERDVMRSLQLLPGVKQESEVSSGFQVRGGTSAQNAVLYDHVPVYNVGHLAGLFSAFNGDALAGATLYKGCPPVAFGGGSSAVLDVSSRSGATDGWHGGATVGLLSAKASVEGPIDERTTLLACARRSYADLPLKLTDDYKDNTLYFYDANARVDYHVGANDRLMLSLLGSKDHTALEDMVSLQWTNLAASLSWRHHVSDASSWQTSLMLSNYATKNGIDLLDMDLSFSGYIRQWGLRQDFALAVGPCRLSMGAQSMVVDVKTAEWQNVNNHEKEVRRAWENTLWAGAEMALMPRLTAQAGLRLTTFSSLGGPYYYEVDEQGEIVWLYKTRRYHIVNTHLNADPRLQVLWRPTPLLSVKAGYGL